MKSFLTFDYELFFGNNSGTVQKCIIEPTDRLIEIAQKTNAKMIFFVDAGYLKALNKYHKKYPAITKDLDALKHQLEQLVKLGHDIQLHIHPHWEDSYFDGHSWVFDINRYKLSAFSEDAAIDICSSYKSELNEFTDSVFAYRAGGWCIQPFDLIGKGLKKNDIWLDSTVYSGGQNKSSDKGFNFLDAPKMDYWHFENDPIKAVNDGYFLELPISCYYTSPAVYWKVAFNRLFPNKKHNSIGDGNSLSSGSSQTMQLLTRYTNQPVFLDGFKSINLKHAYKTYLERGSLYFTAIGHPKAMSEYSFKNLDALLQTKNAKFVTYNDIKEELLSI